MNYFQNYNPYYPQQLQPQAQRLQQLEQQYPQYAQPQYTQPQYKQPLGLQGKSVDSLEVVKAMDIPSCCNCFVTIAVPSAIGK